MRFTKPIARISSILGVLGLVMVICVAGAGVTAASTPHRTSRARLISQADTICRRVNQQFAPYQKQINELAKAAHPDYKRLAAVLKRGVVVEQNGLGQLRALPVPGADRAAVTKVWNQLGTIVSASGAMSTALGNDDITAVNRATQRRSGAEVVYHRLAQGFGFRICGSSSSG